MPEIRGLVFAFVITGMVLLGVALYLNGLQTAYSSNITGGNSSSMPSNYTTLFNKTAEITGNVSSQARGATSNTGGINIPILSDIYSGLSWAWNTLKLIWGILDIGAGLVSDMVVALNISSGVSWWIINGISVMITLIIAFEIISGILKYKV